VVTFLTTEDCSSQIRKLIDNSKVELVLISPFFNPSSIQYERLQDAAKRNVKITVVYGKGELKSDVKKRFEGIKGITILYYGNLHAKLYYNENNMILTSLNFYQYSMANNREMGVHIWKDKSGVDQKLFERAKKEAIQIIDYSTKMFPSPPSLEVKKHPSGKEKSTILGGIKDSVSGFTRMVKNKGSCIGCRTEIGYNPYKPYCLECFNERKIHPRPSEKFCHDCGKSKKGITRYKSQCKSCYEASYEN
jgi:hypothetical protein